MNPRCGRPPTYNFYWVSFRYVFSLNIYLHFCTFYKCYEHYTQHLLAFLYILSVMNITVYFLIFTKHLLAFLYILQVLWTLLNIYLFSICIKCIHRLHNDIVVLFRCVRVSRNTKLHSELHFICIMHVLCVLIFGIPKFYLNFKCI